MQHEIMCKKENKIDYINDICNGVENGGSHALTSFLNNIFTYLFTCQLNFVVLLVTFCFILNTSLCTENWTLLVTDIKL